MESLVHVRLWVDRIGTDGNSEDESDGEVELGRGVVYWIVPLEWRSKELVKLLRALDVLHLSTRFDEKGKPTPGQWPRYRREKPPRVPNYEVDGVPGLPRNFYNPLWLVTRSQWELERLGIRDDVEVDLSIPEDVQR